jgi:hypothetical protein
MILEGMKEGRDTYLFWHNCIETIHSTHSSVALLNIATQKSVVHTTFGVNLMLMAGCRVANMYLLCVGIPGRMLGQLIKWERSSQPVTERRSGNLNHGRGVGSRWVLS